MQHTRIYWIALVALAAGCASAQPGARPDPADAVTRVAEPAYRSAFEGFARLDDQPRLGWREANEEAARIGGHIGILREQRAGEKAAGGERR